MGNTYQKEVKKLKQRIAAFERTRNSSKKGDVTGYKQPGSMNRHKQLSNGAK